MSGMPHAHAAAEQLDAAARAGALHLGRLELAGLAELLGNRGGEGIDRRGTDHRDVVPARLGAGRVADSQRASVPAKRKSADHVLLLFKLAWRPLE